MRARLGQTPWQTVGPFFHYALPWKGGADLIEGGSDLGARLDLVPAGHDLLAVHQRRAAPSGQQLEITGLVLDADGAPIVDALVEIWQADSQGRYGGSEGGFLGFGRCATDEHGRYRFRTIRPGRVAGPNGTVQAAHIAFGVLGRGLLKRLATRLYFADDPANADDPVLALVPEDRRDTLLARMSDGVWRFDIRIAGPQETVFFEI